MASTRKLVVQVLGDARGLSKSLKQASWETMSFGEKVAASTKKMALPAAAAFGALSASAVAFARAAADDQKAAALLASQLRTTTGATQAQIVATEDYISKLALASGVADDQLRPALASLVRATGDVAKAQQLLGLGLDISAATGRNLSSVVQALSRASQGQFTALRRLGIPLSDNIIKSKDFAAAIEALTSVFGGKADVAAQTTEGRMRRLGVAVDEAKEAIGMALLPAVEALLPKLIGMAQWAEKNAGKIATVGVAIAGIASAMLAANTAIKIWSAAAKVTTLLNMGLASSYFAVQIATGIGAAAAIAGAAAVAGIALNLRNAAEESINFAEGMDTATESVRYGYTPSVMNAKDATTQLFGIMGATSAEVLSLGDSMRGGLMGPMGGTLAEIATSAKAVDTATRSAGGSANSAKSRFEAFRNQVKSTKDAVREYVRSIAQSIASTVSLADAFSTAQQEQADAAQALTDALQSRKDAYDSLNQARQTGDTLGYAKALQDVAAAEAAVGAAQAVKARDYTQVFRDQINAAKNFASNLVALNKTGNLSRAALQQLLALGPVAGAQVTADLLAGVAGFTAQTLSADLAGVQRAGMSVGMSVPGVSELLGARASGSPQNYYITVQAGVGDKAEIAREIVDLLKVYNRSNGAIPVRVKG